jgi:peptidoglycan hydrolase-like protein with peptidoglycan-binding domain
VPPPLPPWPVFQYGSQGSEVYAIQYLLRAHGYSLTADGIYGPNTRSSVQQFQGASGLTADGIVGPNTWNALISGYSVSKGSSGEAVRAVQQLLVDKFGYGLTIDGVFGTNTDVAVHNFQSSHGLIVDGIVGKKTWKMLIGL